MNNDWYSCIEEPVRDLIKHLRNNGINTVCSCGHEMYIQADLIPDGELKHIHDLIYCWLAENQKPINYSIEIHLAVSKGIIVQCFVHITLDKNKEKQNG